MKIKALLFLHFKNNRSLISLAWMQAHAKQFSRNRLKMCELQPDFHTDDL